MSETKQSYTLTQSEWDRYQTLKAEVIELVKESETRRETLRQLQADMRSEYAKWAREMNERAEAILALNAQLCTQTSAARRSAAGLVLALKALQALRDLVMEGKVSNDSFQWPGEVFRAVQDAEEVIRAYGIPF